MAMGSTEHCSSLVEKGGIEIFLRSFSQAYQNNNKTILEIVIY